MTTYLVTRATQMNELLFKQPLRHNDLIKAASYGCKALTDLLSDSKFKMNVSHLFHRPLTHDLEGKDLAALTSYQLGHFSSFLPSVKTLMEKWDISPQLVQAMIQETDKLLLLQPVTEEQGDIGTFFRRVEEVRDKTCNLSNLLRQKENEAVSASESKAYLERVVYLLIGLALASAGPVASLDPDLPYFAIAFVTQIGGVLGSALVGIAMSPPVPLKPKPTIQKRRRLFQWRVAIPVLIFVVVVIVSPLIYIKYTHPNPTLPALTASARATHSYPLPFGDITASFYTNPNNTNPKPNERGTFDITPSTPSIFTQLFHVIAFNPDPSAQNCSESTGVNTSTRPFTDVFQKPDGSCMIIRAENGGDKAGLGNLSSFDAVFLTSVIVPDKDALCELHFPRRARRPSQPSVTEACPRAG